MKTGTRSSTTHPINVGKRTVPQHSRFGIGLLVAVHHNNNRQRQRADAEILSKMDDMNSFQTSKKIKKSFSSKLLPCRSQY